MNVRGLVVSFIVAATVVTGCSAGSDGASRPVVTRSNQQVGPAVSKRAVPPTRPATAQEPAVPCMTLLSEIPAAAKPTMRGGFPLSPGNNLTRLDAQFGPTLTFGFTFDGPVTRSRSFAGQQVSALVLDRLSTVDVDAVKTAVERLALRVPVVVLRSCVSQNELRQVRREVEVFGRIGGPHSMVLGLSPALGAVTVTAAKARFARALRAEFGDRVRVTVGRVSLLQPGD